METAYTYNAGRFLEVGKISANNRAFLYGDGFFETFLVDEGIPSFWPHRAERMRRTASFLGLTLVKPDELREAVRSCLREISGPVRVRLTFYRAEGGRYLPESRNAEITLHVEALAASPFHAQSLNRCDVGSIQLPVSAEGNFKLIGKHWQVKAAMEAKARSLDDLVLCNERNEVCESIAGNLFVRMQGSWKTPALRSGCLDGAVRRCLLTRSDIEETDITLEHLSAAEAMYSCNSIQGIVPLTFKGLTTDLNLVTDHRAYLESKMWEA